MRFSRINPSLLALTLAIAAGLCAAWAARQYLHGRQLQLEAISRVATIDRLVAAIDLEAGTVLELDHFAVRPYPEELAPSDSLPPERHKELLGAVLKTPLLAGDLLLPVHADATHDTAFSRVLSAGRRAVTMPVDAINSVSGLLKPGDLIDLYVSFDHQRRRITAPLLQGVLVLATGTSTTQAPATAHHAEGYSTITLDTAPEDAVKLVAARQGGTLTAVLRSPSDDAATTVAARGDLAGLLGVNRPASSASTKVRVIYGNTAVRNVPALVPTPVGAQQAAGLFQLPHVPPLASAWMHAPTGAAPSSIQDGAAALHKLALQDGNQHEAWVDDSGHLADVE
ncbi:Flp pilus assembly protein CpaB [Pusillimonas sp. ANT_WB101]|uniref:Flp pilus assembly protein CpaB n=1 Tax=Pusillimonas sp. ANT_WB101 TaxID=2597356 RepID=UPI0011F05AC4|nr:Flp pilus assembly protein CpaB [Pusillimonas sp. ANT_WB101]KAA0911683.1 Flp pilus assembly protein CpaB [Pusillimonas sp. ANT_WB101]